MRTIALLIFLIYSISTSSQSFAPIGAKWTHSIGNFWLGDSHVTWTVTGDSIVFGKKCSVIKKVPRENGEGDFDDEFICYEDNKVVYFYNPVYYTFSVFIDFNANSGDSWTTLYPYINNDSCLVTTHVDSTDSISINGFMLKRLFVHLNDSAVPHYIITERLGYTDYLDGFPEGHGFYPGKYVLWYCNKTYSVDGPEYAGLKCYEDSVIGLVELDSTANCPYVGINEESTTVSIEPSPNPANTEVIIKGDFIAPVQLELIDFSGRICPAVYSHENHAIKLNVSSLTKGMYCIRIVDKGKVFQSKIIVQH